MGSSRKHKVDLRAEELCSRYLADANEADAAGKRDKADKLYAKAQYWLDRANKARGWGE